MTTTKRSKPWPGVANRARLDSIEQAEEIQALVKQCRLKIKQRNLDLALLLLSQIEKSAQIIGLQLTNAPSAETEPSEE